MKSIILLSIVCVLCQWTSAQEPVGVPADSLSIEGMVREPAPTDSMPTDTVTVVPARIGSISAVVIDSATIDQTVSDTVIGGRLPENILSHKLEGQIKPETKTGPEIQTTPEDQSDLENQTKPEESNITVEQPATTLGAHRLFNDEMRTSSPAVVLDYVEAAYRHHFSSDAEETYRFADITFVAGSWDMLRLVSDSTLCSLSLINGRTYRVVWQDLAEMTFPVQYDRLLGGTRSEIENRLIARLGQTAAQPHSSVPDSMTVAEAAGRDCYSVRGDIYGISQVNRDYHLQVDDNGLAHLVFDSIHPAQSLANLFVCGIEGQRVPMTITIPKHAYGVRDTVRTTVAALDEVCGADGCVAYWGTELLTEDCLRGSVFLYNMALGYDHVLSVECDPRLIGTEQLALNCRMSLFIPTTNVKDLYVTIGPKATAKEAGDE